MLNPRRMLALTALAWAVAAPARAETYEIHPGDDLWGRLASLAPGDEVIIHAGAYPQTSRFEATWAGTEAMPIVIRGADGEARPVLMRDSAQNLLNIHGSWFTLRGLELVGGSHGIRMSDVDHATFEDLEIHDTGDVGMSCNLAGRNCSFVTIRGCEIHHTSGTGEAMYLGCHDGSCAFTDSLVERNFIHDLGGSQGDGIEIKMGSWSNVVRDNVIFDPLSPGVIVYTFEPGEGRRPNVIERNLIIGARGNGIQATGRAIVRNNVVIDAGASGIASQPNQGTPTEVRVLFNTVAGAGDSCFRANSWDSGTGFVVANNALYCEGARAIRLTSTHSALVAGNVVRGSVEGVASGFAMGEGLEIDLGTDTSLGRVYPPAASALIDAADPAHTIEDDFDLRPRGAMADVGAYERDASGMPAWLATRDFKEIEVSTPTPDAGMPSGDGGVTELDAGSVSDDGGPASSSDGGPGSVEAGCGCRTAGRNHAPPWVLGLMLLGIGARLRRR